MTFPREERISDLEFCALDLETTGANPLYHRIVEIGMVRFTLNSETAAYETLVNPGMEIDAKVQAIHGIGNDMVRRKPDMASLLPGVEEFIGSSILVIHNPDFDLAFLAGAFRAADRTLPAMQALDTVRLARHAWPDLPNHKLDTLCAWLGIELSHHRAMADARGAMELFRRIIGMYDPSGSWLFRDLLKIHGEPVRPRAHRPGPVPAHDRFSRIMGRRTRIRYRDSSGEVTERDILPRELVRYGRTSYLVAFCYLRNSERFFNTKNILEMGQGSPFFHESEI